jgi:hypothetical protein
VDFWNIGTLARIIFRGSPLEDKQMKYVVNCALLIALLAAGGCVRKEKETVVEKVPVERSTTVVVPPSN